MEIRKVDGVIVEERTPSGKDTKNPVTWEWKVSLKGEKKTLAAFQKEMGKLFDKYIPDTNDGYIEKTK